MTGQHSLQISPQAPSGTPQPPIFVASSPDSHPFLQLEKGHRDGRSIINVYEVTKHFNSAEAFFYLGVMYQLLQTIVSTRLFRMEHPPESRPGDVGITAFSCLDLDKDDVVRLGTSYMQFRITV